MKKAHDLLGDIPDHHVWMLLHVDHRPENSPLPAMAMSIVDEVPMVRLSIRPSRSAVTE